MRVRKSDPRSLDLEAANWTQDAILQRIEAGQTLVEIFKDYARLTSRPWTALKRQFYIWRKQSKDFDRAVRVRLAARHTIVQGTAVVPGGPQTLDEKDPGWMQRFLHHYLAMEKPSIAAACREAGISISTFNDQIADFNNPSLSATFLALRRVLAGGARMAALEIGHRHTTNEDPRVEIQAGGLLLKAADAVDGANRRSDKLTVEVMGTIEHRLTREGREHLANRMRVICRTPEGHELLAAED